MGGTKADQEELQCQHPELTENIWKPFKLLSYWSYWTQSNTMHGLVLDRFCSRWQITSELTNSQFNMFKHVRVKTTELTMLVGSGLLWVRSYSDVAWCCYMPNTFTKHSDARQWKPSKFEQLSDIHKERVLKNAREVSKHVANHGVIGVDLWSIHLSHPEQVGGCRWTTVEYHKHHAFPIDSRPTCWKPHHLLWGWPCQLRCTRNIFRMGARTKADQEELQCHHPELIEKPSKLLNTMKNHALLAFGCTW